MNYYFIRFTRLMALLLLSLGVINAASGQTYCTPTFSFGCSVNNNSINTVQLGTINNGPFNCNAVWDYTALSTSIPAGVATPMTVITNNFVGVGVYVDLNHDGDFDDPGEWLYGQYIATAPATHNFNITIPAATPPGTYRMRVVGAWGWAPAAGQACMVYTNYSGGGLGNYHDYTLNVYLPCPITITGTTPGFTCGPGTVTLSATSNTPGVTFRWYTAATGGTLVGTGNPWTTPVITSTTTYYVAATDGTCESVLRVPVVATVYPVALTPVVTPSTPVSICLGSSQVLTISVPPTPATLFTENFEGGSLGNFTLVNETNHVSGVNGQWINRTSPYTAFSQSISSGAAGNKYALATSNVSNVPTGGLSNTSLTSGSVSTLGYSSLTLSFRHYFSYGNLVLPDSAFVQVSTNGGTTWNTVQVWNSTQGAAATFATATVNLNAYINQASLRFRLRYKGNFGNGWAVDDVQLTGVAPTYTYSWTATPPANAGLPIGAGTPSAGNNSISVTPTVAGTYTYTGIATNSDGCSASTNTATVTVTSGGIPSATITVSPSSTVCAGTPVTFTATPSFGGTAPVYTWKNGGTAIPSAPNTATFTYTPAAGDVISCDILSNAGCVSTQNGTSNSITMTVTPTVTPSASITVTPTGSVCAGTSVTFTATPTNGGTVPGYQWRNATAQITGATNATYTYTPANGDQIDVVLTSTANCPSPATATSNVITMSVNPVLTPSVTIAANPGTTVCAGTSVTYTATPTNPGTSPVYAWYVGTTLQAATGTTFTYTPSSGDVVKCTLTSNALCVSTTSPVNSNNLTMTVNPILVPATSIAVNPGTTVCAGTAVTVTATSTNAGTGATYTWYKNSVAQATPTGATYTFTPVAGDVVYTVLHSTATCATPANATSNNLTFTVNPLLTTAVSIAANPGNTVCAGTPVTFTATPTNPGTAPTYEWRKNNVIQQTGSNPVYSYTPASGDIIICRMTSNAVCPNPASINSNSITMTVNPMLTPSVTINPDPGSRICEGTGVTFTAIPVNGGSAPVYTWFKNSSAVGTASTYTDNSLSNGDLIRCVLTSNAGCRTQDTALRDVSIQVDAVPVASMTAGGPTIFCTGEAVVLQTPVVSGATYQWQKNGTDIIGGYNNSYLANTGGSYNVVVHLPAPAPCPAISVPVNITALPQPMPTIVGSGNVLNVTNGPFSSYQWYLNSQSIIGATASSYTVLQSGNYHVLVGDASGCDNVSADLFIVPTGTGTVSVDGIKIYPNPAQDELTLSSPVRVSVSMLSVDGKEVLYQRAGNGVIDLRGLSSGVYLMRILDEDQRLIKIERVVKQ